MSEKSVSEQERKKAVYSYDSVNRRWLVCQNCGKKTPAWMGPTNERYAKPSDYKKECKWCGYEHA